MYCFLFFSLALRVGRPDAWRIWETDGTRNRGIDVDEGLETLDRLSLAREVRHWFVVAIAAGVIRVSVDGMKLERQQEFAALKLYRKIQEASMARAN